MTTGSPFDLPSDQRQRGGSRARTVLLIEDDAGDALLFEELVADADPALQVHTANSLEAGLDRARAERPHCVVVDLGLPGVQGMDAVLAVRAALPDLPVVVLTGWSDEGVGQLAIEAGAQDYLVKGQENGGSIARAVRFAIERKRVETVQAQLTVAAARQKEQHRLERNLLAHPLLHSDDVRLASRYVVSRDGLIGGDFSDCVELADGTLRMVVGDVAGHGTDEAALGVALRIAWRALVLGSPPDADVFPQLEALLNSERSADDIFATACDITIDHRRTTLTVRSAGHPPPILSDGRLAIDEHRRAPLGVSLPPNSSPPGTTFEIETPIEITLYTDGLFEVRGESGRILSLEDVEPIIVKHSGTGPGDLARLLGEIEAMAVTGWRDDVALARLALGPLA
jgi:serine phosphatase RsbU (regulator of sigma subunit)